jgi:hypothetical protein
MQRRALLRASDADRERVAERLRAAALEGRLTDEELEERLAATYRSRTYGELDTLLGDLPTPPVPLPRRSAPPARVRRSGATALMQATLLLAILALPLRAAAGAVAGHLLRDGPHGGYDLAMLAGAVFGVLPVLLVLIAVFALVTRAIRRH